MSYKRFISDQHDLVNIAKAYKNNPEFKQQLDNDPKMIFENGVGNFQGEVCIFWNNADDHYLILPMNPNICVDDEEFNNLSAAKWQFAGSDEISMFYIGETGEKYGYLKQQGNSDGRTDGLAEYYKIDENGYKIIGSEFIAKAPQVGRIL